MESWVFILFLSGTHVDYLKKLNQLEKERDDRLFLAGFENTLVLFICLIRYQWILFIILLLEVCKMYEVSWQVKLISLRLWMKHVWFPTLLKYELLVMLYSYRAMVLCSVLSLNVCVHLMFYVCVHW